MAVDGILNGKLSPCPTCNNRSLMAFVDIRSYRRTHTRVRLAFPCPHTTRAPASSSLMACGTSVRCVGFFGMTTKCTFTQPLTSTARNGGPWLLSAAMLKAPVLKAMLENGEGCIAASNSTSTSTSGAAAGGAKGKGEGQENGKGKGKGKGKRKASDTEASAAAAAAAVVAVAEGESGGSGDGGGGGGGGGNGGPAKRKKVERKALPTNSNLRLADRVSCQLVSDSLIGC